MLESFIARISADAAEMALHGEASKLSEFYDVQFEKLLLKPLRKESPSLEHKKLVYEVYVAYNQALADLHHVIHHLEEKASAAAPEVEEGHAAHREQGSPSQGVSRTGSTSAMDLTSHFNQLATHSDEVRKIQIAALKKCETEHKDNGENMAKVFDDMEADCTSTMEENEIKSFKAQKALSTLLLKQRDTLEHMLHEGILDSLDFGPLFDDINGRIGQLILEPMYDRFSPLRQAKRSKLKTTLIDGRISPRKIRKAAKAETTTAGSAEGANEAI